MIPALSDFRLTLTSGTPVLTADTTGTTLYLTPFRGNRLALWNTTESLWEVLAFAEQSIALSLGAHRRQDLRRLRSLLSRHPHLRPGRLDERHDARHRDCLPGRRAGQDRRLDRRLIGTFRALSATQIEWKLGGTGAGGVAASLGSGANPKGARAGQRHNSRQHRQLELWRRHPRGEQLGRHARQPARR